jgi:hypothetical protein
MSIGKVNSHTSEQAKMLTDEKGCWWTVIPGRDSGRARLVCFLFGKMPCSKMLSPVGTRMTVRGCIWQGVSLSRYLKLVWLDMGWFIRYKTLVRVGKWISRKDPFFLEANSSEDEKVLGRGG